MSKSDDIESLTRELTNFLLKAKGEINRLKSEAKKSNEYKNAVTTKFKEMYDENQKLTQKLREYEHYYKSHAIQKKINARAAKAKEDYEISRKKKKQMEEIAILEEIKKLKKLDVESLLGGSSSKRKKDESESGKESSSKSKKEKKSSKKIKKN